MKTSVVMLVMLTAALGVSAADAPTVPAPLVQPPESPGLVITADAQIVSLKTNTVIYSNNVVATYPPTKAGEPPVILHADFVIGQWGAKNKMTNVTASGHVQLDNGDNHARGGRGVYSSGTEQIVLSDPYSTEFPLPMLYSSQITNTGTNIVYDRRQSKLFIKGVTTSVPASTVSKADLSLTGDTKTNAPRTNRIGSPNTNTVTLPQTNVAPGTNAPSKKLRPTQTRGLFR